MENKLKKGGEKRISSTGVWLCYTRHVELTSMLR